MNYTTNYITDSFDKFVSDTANRLFTNDDLYDECLKLLTANKTDTEANRLINSCAYGEIAYIFRKKKLDTCGETHGTYYKSYADTVRDAKYQVCETRDRLLDYCKAHNCDFAAFFA